MRLHVKEGYFFTPPKGVTSPIWGAPPLCKQALSMMNRSSLIFLRTKHKVVLLVVLTVCGRFLITLFLAIKL